MKLRKQYQERYVKRYGHKLGFMSFFVKAVIEGLKAYPAVNAEIDESDPKRPAVVYKNYYNIGVAVSHQARGLVVPVVQGRRSACPSPRPRQSHRRAGGTCPGRQAGPHGRLCQDGTFTISNGGVFGSPDVALPILNPPQVAILGMHTIQRRPGRHRGHRSRSAP